MESEEPGPGTIQGLLLGAEAEGAGARIRKNSVTYDQGVPTYN